MFFFFLVLAEKRCFLENIHLTLDVGIMFWIPTGIVSPLAKTVYIYSMPMVANKFANGY